VHRSPERSSHQGRSASPAALRLLVSLAALLLLTAASATTAQLSPTPDLAVEVAPDSPRAALREYLERCRAGDYASAARHLSLRSGQPHRGPELARRLKAVLDRHLWIDIEAVSPASGGDESDGLPAGVDELGRIAWPGGPARVRLVRTAADESAIWRFGPETVAQVDSWYRALGDRWLRDRLPDWLLRPGPLDLAWWQWAAVPLVLLLSWGLGRLLGWLTLKLLARVTVRTRAAWDEVLIGRLGGPVVLAWAVTAAYPLTAALSLYPPARAFVGHALGTLGLAALFWALWRGVGLLGQALRSSPCSRGWAIRWRAWWPGSAWAAWPSPWQRRRPWRTSSALFPWPWTPRSASANS
jgi:MscS family membrane protein